MIFQATSVYLDQLIELGYGENRGDVADYLVARELDELLRAGVLRPRKFNRATGELLPERDAR